jgi:hypothetical protein
MLEFALLQLAVERAPKSIKIGEQRGKRDIERRAQPRDVQIFEHIGFLIRRDPFVADDL